MAQGATFPLRKPPGFHYDFFLLGITTFVAGLIGVPAPNGLIPQAPIHTTSLLIMGTNVRKRDEEYQSRHGKEGSELDPSRSRHEIPVAVVEQRVSNLAQGALCLILLTGPFLHVLNLIPRGTRITWPSYLGFSSTCFSRCIGRTLVRFSFCIPIAHTKLLFICSIETICH